MTQLPMVPKHDPKMGSHGLLLRFFEPGLKRLMAHDVPPEVGPCAEDSRSVGRDRQVPRKLRP